VRLQLQGPSKRAGLEPGGEETRAEERRVDEVASATHWGLEFGDPIHRIGSYIGLRCMTRGALLACQFIHLSLFLSFLIYLLFSFLSLSPNFNFISLPNLIVTCIFFYFF
jgi:hypothetical protein